MLALFDFSSALDAINHRILEHRLHTDFEFTDAILQWSSFYLTNRTHYILLSNHCSAISPVLSGVPQGSVLCPILCTILSLCLLLLTNTLSYAIQFLMTYNYRCLFPLIEYLSFFTLCSHVYVMSMLQQLRTCLSLMTTRQIAFLSPKKELSISITDLLQSL